MFYENLQLPMFKESGKRIPFTGNAHLIQVRIFRFGDQIKNMNPIRTTIGNLIRLLSPLGGNNTVDVEALLYLRLFCWSEYN